jgi:uncharacterized protein (TIGR02145 family)
MKIICKLFILMGFILAIPGLGAFSQTSINTDGSSPDPSAMLDVKSTNKGMLIPRMTAVQRTGISAATNGLLVFQTDAATGFYYHNGTAWTYLGTGEGDGGHMIDGDGNDYPTIIIGNQEWMAENLRVTHYRNGDAIPNYTTGYTWSFATDGAYCWYNNDAVTYKLLYGALYNWYAVNDPRNICPAGWHVATDAEWSTFVTQLGGESTAGGKMKAAVLWNAPNTGTVFSNGFSGLPGGYRNNTSPFLGVGSYCNFWTATEDAPPNAWYRYLSYDNAGALRNSYNEKSGFSVRCVRD